MSDRPKVLVVAPHPEPPAEPRRALRDSVDTQKQISFALADHFDVVMASTLDEAIAALRKDDFAGVLSDAGDFLPLERALVTQQAGLILNTIGEGVCVVDAEGRPGFMNKRLLAWPEPVREHVRKACQEAIAFFLSLPTAQIVQGQSTRCRRCFVPIEESQQHLELMISPVLTPNGQVVQVVAVVWDATATRRLQQKIDAIDRAGRELMRLDAESLRGLHAQQRLRLLEEKIIGFAKQLMHFDHFAIRLLDRTSNRLELVMSSGLPPEALNIELFASTENNGISGFVAASGRSYICSDVQRDPRYVTGLDHAKSSLTVPLMSMDRVVGIFNVESTQLAAFTEDDRQFAEIFGRYIAMALSTLDLLVRERVEVSTRVADSVIVELEGPLNDIELDARDLLEDFIGNEPLRDRVDQILSNLTIIRTSLQQVQKGTNTTVLGARQLSETPAVRCPILGGRRILVVDDEPNIRQTIGALLRRYQADVTVADCGNAAIELLGRQVFDLILSDIRMPDRTGYEVFAATQKLEQRPPVILMTGFGYDPGHTIVRASQEGLAAVLFKPFRAEHLINEVRAAIRAREESPAHA